MSPAEQLVVIGPYVTVEVTPPRGRGSATVRLMIDTGAEQSILDEAVVAALGTPRRGSIQIAGVTSSASLAVDVHRVHFAIDGVNQTIDLDVVALPRDGIGDGLLGRDVLAHLRFLYDGPAGTFRLE